MKTIFKTALAFIAVAFILIADVPILFEQLVPDAHAIFGVRRRALRRGVIIGAASATAVENISRRRQPNSRQQRQHHPLRSQRQPGNHCRWAPWFPPSRGLHPHPVGGEEYYYCGGNFYRAVFQGNNLVYVTAKPQ